MSCRLRCFAAAVVSPLIAADTAYAFNSLLYGRATNDSLSHEGRLSVGKVYQVDQEASSIIVKTDAKDHQAPTMMRLFAIHPAILDDIRAGDKVGLRAQRKGEAFVVTEIRRCCNP